MSDSPAPPLALYRQTCDDVYTPTERQHPMINFVIDGTEYTAEIVTLDQFEADHYDEAILAGAGFTTPDGQEYVVLAPKAVA